MESVNRKANRRTFKSKNGRWLVTIEFKHLVHSFDFEQELDYREEGVVSPCKVCEKMIDELL